MDFEQMNAIQRRLHNAACVLGADGDEHGFEQLQRDAIAEIDRLKAELDAGVCAALERRSEYDATLVAAERERWHFAVDAFFAAHDSSWNELCESAIAAGVYSVPITAKAGAAWNAMQRLRNMLLDSGPNEKLTGLTRPRGNNDEHDRVAGRGWSG
jgi:roadblock/LC7 domain-containing protein